MKNLLLTSDRARPTARSSRRRYAWRLEKKCTKDEILERYLNTVYFGNNAYGLQAAAEMYFGKNVDQLDVWEGAFLAGLIRNPSGYDPLAQPERARARFRQAIDRLVAVGKVTAAQAAGGRQRGRCRRKQLSTPQTAVPRSYFTEEVRKQLLNETTILGSDHQARYNALFRGGLRIYTTLDPTIQAGRRPGVAEQLPDTGGRFQAALAAEDAKTGAVVAMVGGRGFDQSQVNLALTPRQTGSSAKLFILLAALQAGVQPNDTIDGTLPCALPNPGSKQPFLIHDGVSRGVDTVATMTALSINCAYAKLGQIVGLSRVVDTAHRLGVKSDIQPIAAFATGGNEISPLDFATAAPRCRPRACATTPTTSSASRGPTARSLYQHQDPGTQAVPTDVALSAIDTLKGVIKQRHGRELVEEVPGHPPGGGQDRDVREQHQRHLRRLHHAAVGGRVAGQPAGQRHRRHAQHPGVPRRGRGQRARRQPAVPDLGGVHRQGQRGQGLPRRGLAGAAEAGARLERLYLPGKECLYRCSAAPRRRPTAPTDRRAPASTPRPPPRRRRRCTPGSSSGTTIPPDQLDPAAPGGRLRAGGRHRRLVRRASAPPPAPPTARPRRRRRPRPTPPATGPPKSGMSAR